MAQSGGGGGIAAKREKISSSGAGAAAEDRLSALPDDVLVLILLHLDTTAGAARTSVLSRRWRHLWARLPVLRFHLAPDGHRIREVLGAHDLRPPLRWISVTSEDSAPDSLGAWLPEAARCLSGYLVYTNMVPRVDEEEEEEDQVGERGAVQLPCFENASGINLNLGWCHSEWRDSYDPSSVQLGNLVQPQRLKTDLFLVHCEHGSGENRCILKLLQQFRFIHILNITLAHLQDINDSQYLMGDVAMLPQIRFLHLTVFNQGHSLGASSFHPLKMCTGLRELSFVLHGLGGLRSCVKRYQAFLDQKQAIPA
ncbi:unnamed protein product [Urochloa decumbens]|uniref:F-box domain-containing protein n=1 Tax=Urochloa decumbens TaxID=240449 RepID=A0ABC9AQ06_9POAL